MPPWLSFLIVIAVSTGLLYLGWRSIRREAPPRWLAALVVGAALIRLCIGILWDLGLPVWGYHSPAEQAGYVFIDAYNRDQSAWGLSQDQKPLYKAFQGGYRRFDQYGGLLFLSAAVYRYLGGPIHEPLLIVVLCAAISSLAVLFTWAFAKRAWEERAAGIAAIMLAFYPEAVLLGSAQMREAFTIPLVMAAFYGLMLLLQTHERRSLVWILGAVVLCLPFSPPFAGLLLLLVLLLGIIMNPQLRQAQIWRQRRTWVMLAGVAALIGIGVWLSWSSFAPQGVSNPVELVSWWVKKSADWQAHLTERASGLVQLIFERTPNWSHIPALLLYGILQPFLPAALGDTTGALIWRIIAIWRAVGWTAMLFFILYAPVRALRNIDWLENRAESKRRIVLGVSLVVWIGLLIAAYRGGGDQWDNPRYRAAFAGLQVGLAAWAIVAQGRKSDPWLRRTLVGLGLILAWFLLWYLRRYLSLPWPVDFFRTVGLGLASAALYWLWDWAGEAAKPDQT